MTAIALYLVVGALLATLSCVADHSSTRPARTIVIEFAIVSLGWLPIVLFVLFIGSAVLVAKVLRRV